MSTRLLPVFKYIRLATADISANTKLTNYVSLHNSLEKIIPSNIKKQIQNLPVISDYQELTTEMKKVNEIHKQAGLLLKNIAHYSIEQIRSLCSSWFTLDSDTAMKSTHFKRCVMYIDLMENLSKKKKS